MEMKDPETFTEAIQMGLNSGAREFIAPTVFLVSAAASAVRALVRSLMRLF